MRWVFKVIADPDVYLSATHYSIVEHEEAVDRLLPAVRERGVRLVSGRVITQVSSRDGVPFSFLLKKPAGYNSGFIAGRNRYNYKSQIPKGMKEKRDRIAAVAKDFGIDIITAALQFVLAADEYVSIVPGMRKSGQVTDNLRAWKTEVPADFWKQLKEERLIYEKAQTP